MKNKNEYFWALIGRFIPQSIYLLTTIILARFLSPDDFGMIGVLTVFCTISSVLMDSGLGGSLIKEKNLTKIDCSSIFVFNIVVSSTIYIILLLLSDFIEYYFSHDDLSHIAKILCFIFVLNSWGLVPKALLMRDMKFQIIGKIAIISVSIASICSIILGVAGFGVYALVAYQLINSFVNSLLFILKSSYQISFKFNYSSFKRLIPFGFFTTLVTCIDTFYENMITFIFGKYYNIQQAGYLYQAKKIEEVPSHSLIVAINSVSFSVLTKYKESSTEFVNEANRILKTISVILIPLLLSISLFSKPIISLLYGEEWLIASFYLSILMFAGIFILLENINRNFIKSLGYVNTLFRYTLIKRIIGISIIILSAYFSSEYILYAYVMSSFWGFIVNSYVYCKLLNLSLVTQIIIIIKILIPCFIYYTLVYLSSLWYNLYIQLLIAVFLLLSYYLFILPFYGLDITKFYLTTQNKR